MPCVSTYPLRFTCFDAVLGIKSSRSTFPDASLCGVFSQRLQPPELPALNKEDPVNVNFLLWMKSYLLSNLTHARLVHGCLTQAAKGLEALLSLTKVHSLPLHCWHVAWAQVPGLPAVP